MELVGTNVMAIEIESLFISALGLTAPWRVAKVELNTAQKRIDFNLTCGRCKTPMWWMPVWATLFCRWSMWRLGLPF